MNNKVFEDAPQLPGGAVDKIRKQARQLAYDVRYKVKGKFKEGQKTSPAALKSAYMQQLSASSSPGPVKALAKKMLIGEEYDVIDIDNSLQGLKESVIASIFSEEKAFVLRVTDSRAKTTYYRSYSNYQAASAKKRQLEAKGLRVEISGKKNKDTYDKMGGEKKAKKDYDGDGKVESGSKEHAGVVHNAIQRKKGGVADGQDTRKEEVIYEKEGKDNKKFDVMKGKNKVNVNPTIGESIRANLDALKSQRLEEQEAAVKAAGPSPEERKQLMNKDKMLKKKIMMQNQTMQMQKQGRLPLNYSEEAGAVRYCPKCDKNETRDECSYGGEYWDENSKPAKEEDTRSIPTKINLAKNKLRAMGLKMSYDMEGDLIDERRREDKGTPRSPEPSAAFKAVSREMGSSRLGVQPRGKKKDRGAKNDGELTSVDRIKNRLSKMRAPQPNPYRSRPGESD